MLTQVLESWGSIYANHAALRTAVEFVHVGGLVLGGGCAITADLATITATREGPTGRAAQLHLLGRTHTLVVLGLVALTLSGALLLAADLQTYWSSRVFWLKMILMALLVGNGWLLLRGERLVRNGAPQAWARLHSTASASLVLWLLTTLAGVALPNIG